MAGMTQTEEDRGPATGATVKSAGRVLEVLELLVNVRDLPRYFWSMFNVH
jgi:hypothetical protein